MTLEEKVDAVLSKLDRLELIESHLLDVLLPQRKAFMRQPHPAPPALAVDAVKDVHSAVLALHTKIDALTDKPKKKVRRG